MKQELIILLIGWLLGLLSVPFVSRIEKFYKRNDLKNVLLTELKYLAVRSAVSRHLIQTHLGTSNQDELGWLKVVLERYKDYCATDILESVEKALLLGNGQYDSWAIYFGALSEGKYLGLKSFSLPFVESNLSNLWVFEDSFQAGILSVRERVQMLNEEIELSKHFSDLTFNPDVMATNAQIINDNQKKSYKLIGEQCKMIVELIDKIISDVKS